MKGLGCLMLGMLSSMVAACAMEEASEMGERSARSDEAAPADVALEVRATHRPFFVATFDHEPSAAESDAALARFVAQQSASEQHGSGEVGAMDHAPLPGSPGLPGIREKVVQIHAATSNLANAGTDNSKNFRFEGTWFGPAGQDGFVDRFILDNPGQPDLNRNETSVFYYKLNAPRTSDYFFAGRLLSTSNDAWHCASVILTERSRDGARVNLLVVDKWIDANRDSGYIPYSNGAELRYP